MAKKKTVTRKTTKKTEDNTAWHAFVSWCQERGLTAVPANPWTLSAYARSVEGQLSHKDIVSAFKTIFRVHGSKSRRRLDRDPLVVKTLEQIAERAKEKKAPKEKVAPLFPDDDILKPDAPKKTKKAPPKAKPGKTGKRKVLPGLSTSPKLVSKRKLKK
ncbi:MAG: hypothetical protein HN377_03770 [Alphaproteobacteria bacterium]|nr:hypothetical protein [Alphaproteobacteria bacterium]MBT7941829.1 hypothetical protein [Alphaproteobacteria bacterium]